MRKINFKGLTTKAAGLAAGTVAAGFVQKGVAKLGLTGIMSNMAIVAVGALGPDLLGQKSPLMQHAGDAVMVKGINGLLTQYFPSLISGIEDVAGPYDNVSGYGDYEVSGYGDDEVGDVDSEGIVAGADEEPVSGINAL